MTRLQIKLCGFTRAEDATIAVQEGADLIGVVLWAPSPRSVDRDGARRVREAVPDGLPLVGVGAVAFEAVVREDGADFAVEVYGGEGWKG